MKLKKHISTLLSALILFANIGLVLNVHYCHGKVSSVSVNYRLKDACGEPVQKKKTKGCCATAAKSHKTCCKDNVVKLQDKADKTLVKSVQLDLGAFYVSEAYNNAFLGSVATVAITKNAPAFYAETNAPPLYKLYCQYVFYA
jgi:hypothetical protein